MSVQLVRGDAAHLPLRDGSVDLVVTSPPYFALRSYQDTPRLCQRCIELIGKDWLHPNPVHLRNLREAWPDWDAHVAAEHVARHYPGQIGSEPTPAEFIDALIACTAEWVRVLKPCGSLWVNLGDKYAGIQNQRSRRATQPLHANGVDFGFGRASGWDSSVPQGVGFGGIRDKSLMGLPWRYALRCIDDLGLILRAEVIWSKPNGLPESVTDRVRRSHEQWFHLTKQPRYYAAVDTIREPHTGNSHGGGNSTTGRTDGVSRDRGYQSEVLTFNALGKLPGSVWNIPSQPLTVPAWLGVDHFAAFPMELPRRIIQGWSPSGVCTVCGEGRRPVTSTAYTVAQNRYGNRFADGLAAMGTHGNGRPGSSAAPDLRASVTVTGECCACPDTTAPIRPAVVLDPFSGTGTVCLMADVLGRHGIGVDLSHDYNRLARWRTSDSGERARAMQVDKPETVADGQMQLFA